MRKCMLAMVLLSNTAAAAPYVMDPAHSTLTFEGRQGNVPFHGAFRQFTAVIDSDAEGRSGHVKVTVDIASVTADEKEQQEALPTKDWFDAKQFPVAVFESDFSAAGPDLRRAKGTLTLRGIRRPLTIDFTIHPQPDHRLMALGETTLNRRDFNVGQGQWASDQWVGYPVKLRFNVSATPAKVPSP